MTRRFRLALLFVALTTAFACDTTYEFDDVTVGGDETRAPRPRSDSQFLRALYTDLLGRSPESYDFVVEDGVGQELARFPIDEQTSLLRVLSGVGDPTPLRNMIATGLVNSAEVNLPDKQSVSDPQVFITTQFQRLLGREPNIYELDSFLNEWDQDPAVNPKTIVRAIVASREYQGL